MPDAIKQSPEPGSYNFVLRRYDRVPHISILWAGYEETRPSRNIELEGVRAPTLFLLTRPERDRALKVGWKDETERFHAAVRRGPTGDRSSIPSNRRPSRQSVEDVEVITRPERRARSS